MTGIKHEVKMHPDEAELAGYLDKTLDKQKRQAIESHIACCDVCLDNVVSAYEAVKDFKKTKGNFMKKINIYLILAILAFILSFAMSQFFLQFLTATLLLGIKWVVDSKSTKMLIMIYEAWKKGGETEASRILKALDSNPKNRI